MNFICKYFKVLFKFSWKLRVLNGCQNCPKSFVICSKQMSCYKILNVSKVFHASKQSRNIIFGLNTCKLEHKILNENQSPKSHFHFWVKNNLEWSKVKTKHLKVLKTTCKISILNAQREELECLTTRLWIHVAKITLECHGLKSSFFFWPNIKIKLKTKT